MCLTITKLSKLRFDLSYINITYEYERKMFHYFDTANVHIRLVVFFFHLVLLFVICI